MSEHLMQYLTHRRNAVTAFIFIINIYDLVSKYPVGETLNTLHVPLILSTTLLSSNISFIFILQIKKLKFKVNEQLLIGQRRDTLHQFPEIFPFIFSTEFRKLGQKLS